MSHFVSERCASERCSCGEAATHKLAEEIPHDDPTPPPCPDCSGNWIRNTVDGKPHPCTSPWHLERALLGPYGRHELTAYVCCACFTRVLGPATGCPTMVMS